MDKTNNMKANRQILVLFLLMIMSIASYGQVIITANPADVADTSAMLEVRSLDRGFLPPRMTAEQRDAIVMPAPGLIIFCSNCGDFGALQLRNNYAWVDVMTGPLSEINYPPLASNLQVSGNFFTGDTLTGSYDYSDTEGNIQGQSIYKWYRADNIEGLNKTLIDGQNEVSYIPSGEDLTKHIRFSVIPIAQIGTNPGIEVESEWSTQILSSPPQALDVLQEGNLTSGSLLTGVYTFFDAQGIPEGTSTYKWDVADNAEGLNEVAIEGAVSTELMLTDNEIGKYIRFSVIPISEDPTISIGNEFKADFFGPVEANRAPLALDLSNTGLAISGQTIIGEYTYSDFENDNEGSTIIKWYVADDETGTGETVISGANTLTYTLQVSTIGKYVRMSVIPAAQTGTSTGDEIFASSYIGPIVNAAPEARNMNISGYISTGSFITADFDYFDAEGDVMESAQYKWYRAYNTEGTNEVCIEGETANTYLLKDDDINYMIRFSVVLNSNSGTSPSQELFSPYHGSIIFEVECGVQVLTSNVNVGIMIPLSQAQTNNDVFEKYCYNDLEENCIQNGGLYQWNESMNYTTTSSTEPSNRQGLCPDGYHIPSDMEFSRYEHCVETSFEPIGTTPLSAFQNNTGLIGSKAGYKMKSSTPIWNGSNISGFSARPVGFVNKDGDYSSLNTSSLYWTSTQSSSNYVRARFLSSNNMYSSRQNSQKIQAHSIRCFKD